jgi:hypothetical protein
VKLLGGMNWPQLELRIKERGTLVHQGPHGLAIELDEGPVLVALASDAHAADWLELRLWAGSAAVAPPLALLGRNARLSYGAFCVIDGELYLRAAMPLATLDEVAIGRAIDGLLAEIELLGTLDLGSAAVEDLFGYLT